MKRILFYFLNVLFFFLFTYNIIQAQQNVDGMISADFAKKCRLSDEETLQYRAMLNAVTNGDIRQLALNRENIGKLDHFYAVQLDVGNITDQKSTGRCWLFTGLNVLRRNVIKNYNLKSFEFSESYSFFWDQFEKANMFLEGILETRDKKMDDRKVEWLFKNAIGLTKLNNGLCFFFSDSFQIH